MCRDTVSKQTYKTIQEGHFNIIGYFKGYISDFIVEGVI
jgi:hypothetical protein